MKSGLIGKKKIIYIGIFFQHASSTCCSNL